MCALCEKAKDDEQDKQLEKMYENLRLLRRARGWTIEDLSKLSGIRVKFLTDIEEGRDFDVRYLIRLCRLYGIKAREIFYDLYQNGIQ